VSQAVADEEEKLVEKLAELEAKRPEKAKIGMESKKTEIGSDSRIRIR
jgi:hypothetical protein